MRSSNAVLTPFSEVNTSIIFLTNFKKVEGSQIDYVVVFFVCLFRDCSTNCELILMLLYNRWPHINCTEIDSDLYEKKKYYIKFIFLL